jgi:hypothetical protein
MGRREQTLDPDGGQLEAFAYDLRQLRQAAGGLSYRQLSRRAGYSVSVLWSAARGRDLPTLPVLLAYVGACGGERDAWERRWQELVADGDRRAPELVPATAPATAPLRPPSGMCLDLLVAELGPLSSGAVLTLTVGLAEALASIHRSGLVYRDLTPANVMIDDTGAYLIDFGVPSSPDTTDVAMGEPSYLAPERLKGGGASPASDMFSLGATLVYAATGENVVNAGPADGKVAQLAKGRLDLSNVPNELRPLIMCCISRRPEDRPTAEELLRILVRCGVPEAAPGWYRTSSSAMPVVVPLPSGSRFTRRRMLAFGGVLAAALVGGVGAATDWFRGGLDGRSGAGATAASRPPAPGTVLWRARSGVRWFDRPDVLVAGTRIVVHGGELIITVNGPELRAVEVRGRPLWNRTFPTELIGLLRWGDALLAFDARRMWLVDPTTGAARFFISPADAEEEGSRHDNPDNIPVQIYGVTVSTERAFLGLGTATIAIDRGGRLLWRSPRPAGTGRRSPSGNPHVANEKWLVTRDVIDSAAEIGLDDAATGRRLWETRLTPLPNPTPPPAGLGAPPYNDAWQRSEGRIGDSYVALRDAQGLTVLRLHDGGTVWRKSSPRPVAAIELIGDVLLVAADNLTAYTVATGSEAWQVGLRGALLAVPTNGRGTVAATAQSVSALDAAGSPLWRGPLPEAVRYTWPDTLTTENGIAFVTFKPPPGELELLDFDIVAVALDTGT